SRSALPIFLKNEEIIGFFGFGSRFSGVMIPCLEARLAFSTYILSFSITNFAAYVLVNSLCIKVLLIISRAKMFLKLTLTSFSRKNLSRRCFLANSIKRSKLSIKFVLMISLSSYLSTLTFLTRASVSYAGQALRII